MLKTALISDSRYLAHDATPNHPERPERVGVLIDMLCGYQRDGLIPIEPRIAMPAELLANHSRDLFDDIKATAGKDLHVFDADTAAGAKTFETASLAAGGFLAALDAVMEGHTDNAFALVRPPGHHAEADRAMGFCFFNNVAVGARYLKNHYGLERILIVDWDVHHGNGTQRSFYASRDVLFVSAHQYPHYPGTGALNETGVADGVGYTVNLPFPAGFGDAEYIDAFRRIVEPIARRYDPEFVLISAGFDCHHLDPLGDMHMTKEGFAQMTRVLLSVARDCAAGRCAAVLEGGYSLQALEEGVCTVLDELGQTNEPDEMSGHKDTSGVIDEIAKTHGHRWDI